MRHRTKLIGSQIPIPFMPRMLLRRKVRKRLAGDWPSWPEIPKDYHSAFYSRPYPTDELSM
jgi:hypothetical protein